MRRLLVLLALVGCAMSLVLGTWTPLYAQTPTCPSTATLHQLVAAIDNAVTGPANKDRTCFRQVFLPDARLIPVGANGPHTLSVDDWIAVMAKNGDTMVTEHQIKYQTETFGHIAHLWSTYTTTLAGKPPARGINSFQAVYDGHNWHIIEVIWQTEDAADRIPARYLP
ncbi:MAG: hypothetical protein WBW84_10100 [Acidobacteriaceae bacterium]